VLHTLPHHPSHPPAPQQPGQSAPACPVQGPSSSSSCSSSNQGEHQPHSCGAGPEAHIPAKRAGWPSHPAAAGSTGGRTRASHLSGRGRVGVGLHRLQGVLSSSTQSRPTPTSTTSLEDSPPPRALPSTQSAQPLSLSSLSACTPSTPSPSPWSNLPQLFPPLNYCP